MTPEQKAYNELNRARQAKEILENPLYIEAMQMMDAAIVERWKQSTVDNKEQREYAFLLMKLKGEFQAHFESLVQRGKLADKALAALEKRKKFGII